MIAGVAFADDVVVVAAAAVVGSTLLPTTNEFLFDLI